MTTRLRLRRIRPGLYETLDGRFEIILHPHSKGEISAEWGHREWLIYEYGPTREEIPIVDDICFTLARAREVLSDYIARDPK